MSSLSLYVIQTAIASLAIFLVFSAGIAQDGPSAAPATSIFSVNRDSEDFPFMVGSRTYVSILADSDRPAENIRRRFGKLPFELPSADSCLKHGQLKEALPDGRSLDWHKLLSPAAIEVCLARVLNQFADEGAAVSWLAGQGFREQGMIADSAAQRSHWFDWTPDMPGGPLPLWLALPDEQQQMLAGLSIMIDACDRASDCRQLDNPAQTAPYFVAREQVVSKSQK